MRVSEDLKGVVGSFHLQVLIIKNRLWAASERQELDLTRCRVEHLDKNVFVSDTDCRVKGAAEDRLTQPA